MYLTSFIHREDLFAIAERWFCGRLGENDALRLTEILISDGFAVGETLGHVAGWLLRSIYKEPFHEKHIHFKGELRDAICCGNEEMTPRVEELIRIYRKNPDYFYREAPINGVMCLDGNDRLLGYYRIKRPRRIAEKAHRKIANWIFRLIQDRAREMARERAVASGIPFESLFTPQEEMVREFIEAEEYIARGFSEGRISLERDSLTINDVGGIKIVADRDRLALLEKMLEEDPTIRIIEKESFRGQYQATNLMLEVHWDTDQICRRYLESRGWEKYLDRGVPVERLKRGLAPLLDGGKPKICMEVILSTFPDMVESELGNSLHEKRMNAQREVRIYRGNIPMNVEFLLEYLFAVGFSPQVEVEQIPIKLWGRYLPDTLASQIRRLYNLPPYDLFF